MTDEVLKTKTGYHYKRINGKAYFSHSQLYLIVKSFLLDIKVFSEDDLKSYITYYTSCNNDKRVTASQIINEGLRSFLAKKEGLRTLIGNKVSFTFVIDIINQKILENYQSGIKGDRYIEMFDSNMKALSPASYRKVLNYISKNQGDWIEENKKFKFYYPIKSKVRPLDTIFNTVYKRQGGLCNGSGLPITYDEATLHHKYIPRCIFTCNALWNLEVLSQQEHEKKHKDKFAVVNILIKLHEYYLKIKKRT